MRLSVRGWAGASVRLALIALLGSSTARASGPMGVDSGWVINNDGTPILTASKASALSAAQVGWLRVEFRLVPGHTTWDATMLSYYDSVVNNARAAGIQIIGLLDNTSWPGSQADWCANNWENTGGNGDNSFIDNFAASAAVPVVARFHDRIKVWEVWNEPNAWTGNPSPGVYTGGSFVYPSNFSQILANVYADVKEYNGFSDVTILSGGVFGHTIGGAFGYDSAGAQYLDDTYYRGINVVGSFAYTMSTWGTYPLDAVGEHLYIDQGTVTTSARFQQYCDWVRQAYAKYEGAGTAKKTIITEFGWATNSVSQAVQDQNMNIAYTVLENGSVPYVQNGIWFCWSDNPAAGIYYGVLDGSNNQKICYPDFLQNNTYQGYRADWTLNANIQNYYNALGEAQLGSAYDNGGGPWTHTWSGGAYSAEVQDFNGGSHSRLCIFDSGFGTFEVNQGFWIAYLNNGGISFFGPPTNNEYAYAGGTRQDFSSGHYMTWTSAGGVVVN